MVAFNHIHLHSMDSNPYSGLEVDSVVPFQKYIDQAVKDGMTAIAFTEHGAVLHNIAKRQACEKAGIKYINAEEFYVTETIDENNLVRDNYHCCLFAKNYQGVLELNYLSSISFNRKDGHFYYNPRITLDELINTSDNILVSTACVGGILCKGTKDAQEKFLKFIIENKHRCWLEIQPHNFDLQIRYNQYLYRIANEYGLKLIATNDVHVPRFPHERFRGKNAMGLRGDAIVQFDWSVGEIMKVLDRLKLTENTLIILSSDNGPVLDDGYKDRAAELAGTHKPGGPFRGGKYGAFEAGTCVPAIVRYPAQVKKNRVLNTLLSQVDWFRSLASLINVSVPEGMAQDSWNYMNSWLGKSKKDRHWVIEESNILALSVRKGKWKYIEPSNGSPVITWGPAIETGYAPYDQLFNMGKSDFEDNNVAKQYPVIVREMKEILNKERKGASSSDKY